MSSLSKVAKPKGWQQRIRESRLGTLVVLAVTATIVIVGAYMVDRPATQRRRGSRPSRCRGPPMVHQSAYRVFGIPAHFFFDRTGVLRSIKTGGQSPEQMSAAAHRNQPVTPAALTRRCVFLAPP
jgi:hypothetical protein